MNLSGRSVGQAVRFYKLPVTDLLVVCDDLSLPVGKLRLRPGGSDGGQKGLRDITAQLGTEQFPGSGSASATMKASMPPTMF